MLVSVSILNHVLRVKIATPSASTSPGSVLAALLMIALEGSFSTRRLALVTVPAGARKSETDVLESKYHTPCVKLILLGNYPLIILLFAAVQTSAPGIVSQCTARTTQRSSAS